VNLEEYEKTHRLTYEAYAGTVRYILEQALLANAQLPRPQSIQSRAKEVASLRRRLKEANKLDTETLERDRRDLAGARLVFYTNNDVEQFLGSALIRNNFEIEEDSTKVHHPAQENQGAQYRAIHYTVRLRDERLQLPEYARFAGLRCEIQVQTILNHAWSETSHDIIYKKHLGSGFGERAMEGIARRFKRVMEDYLIPAGYEIQKAEQEYERVLQGQALFDQDIEQLLAKAQTNNERYEILTGLKDYALPHYDDLPKAFSTLRPALLATVQAARLSAPVPIETSFGRMPGLKAEAITRLVVDIIERVGYADVLGVLELLMSLFRDETDKRQRERMVTVVKHLSEYNIDVYRKVGPGVQLALVDHLAAMKTTDVTAVLDLAIAVWTECLQSDISAARWTAQSMTLETGTVPLSDALREVRDKAIAALFAAYDRASEDSQRSAILAAMDAGTATPFQGNVSNEMLRQTLEDSTRIVNFATDRIPQTSYQLLQHLEHQFHHEYQRAEDFTEAGNRFQCETQAQALAAAALRFRDTVNVDRGFVRYKVLVGFNSIFPLHWEEGRTFDFQAADQYRKTQAATYVDDIRPATEAEWFGLIEQCAATNSSDMMTFPIFGAFLKQLAERRPDVAERLLTSASDRLRQFIAPLLDGFSLNTTPDTYDRVLRTELEANRSFWGIARHLRHSTLDKPGIATKLLSQAVQAADTSAVIECFVIVVERFETRMITDTSAYTHDALTYLNSQQNARWIQDAWYSKSSAPFFDGLTPELTDLLCKNLMFLRKLEFHAEAILQRLAQNHLEAVWDYLGARIARESATNASTELPYEPIPYKFHGLEKQLSWDPDLALKKGLAWFTQDSGLFQYRGGRLLSNAFPECTSDFATALIALIRAGGDPEANFALAILQNYRGAVAAHVVLKEIVALYSNDVQKLRAVSISINSTGVVSGENGFAEALRDRKQSVTDWLTDDRPSVQAFARSHITKLGLMIADEERRAEADRELFRRDFGTPDDEVNDPAPGEQD